MDVTQDPAAREPADPVTLSVLLHRLEGVVGEMVQTIEHTALSPLLSLCRDFSCALYDADCRQVCMGAGLPIHTASLNLVLQAINRAFAGDIRDGDLFLCNDPQHGNTHIADLVAACPVFIEDRHAPDDAAAPRSDHRNGSLPDLTAAPHRGAGRCRPGSQSGPAAPGERPGGRA
jgi:N-methylhydantoinase B